MRKHEFKCIKSEEICGYKIVIYKCTHCGEVTGLRDWQLKDIPRTMAECKKGKRVGVLEWITGSYNCLRREANAGNHEN